MQTGDLCLFIFSMSSSYDDMFWSHMHVAMQPMQNGLSSYWKKGPPQPQRTHLVRGSPHPLQHLVPAASAQSACIALHDKNATRMLRDSTLHQLAMYLLPGACNNYLWAARRQAEALFIPTQHQCWQPECHEEDIFSYLRAESKSSPMHNWASG